MSSSSNCRRSARRSPRAAMPPWSKASRPRAKSMRRSSGEVVEVNKELEGDPALVNREAEGDAWFMKVKTHRTRASSTISWTRPPTTNSWPKGLCKELMLMSTVASACRARARRQFHPPPYRARCETETADDAARRRRHVARGFHRQGGAEGNPHGAAARSAKGQGRSARRSPICARWRSATKCSPR